MKADERPAEGAGFAGYWRDPGRPMAYSPVASDNVAASRVLLYGPHGEAILRQEPRRAGFRPPTPENLGR